LDLEIVPEMKEAGMRVTKGKQNCLVSTKSRNLIVPQIAAFEHVMAD